MIRQNYLFIILELEQFWLTAGSKGWPTGEGGLTVEVEENWI